jgi:hypothetical protein
VAPYGIYDVATNTGWVSLGIDHDTAAFAVNAVRRWHQAVGSVRYPKADRLLITADGGGSNGSSTVLLSPSFTGGSGLSVRILIHRDIIVHCLGDQIRGKPPAIAQGDIDVDRVVRDMLVGHDVPVGRHNKPAAKEVPLVGLGILHHHRLALNEHNLLVGGCVDIDDTRQQSGDKIGKVGIR